MCRLSRPLISCMQKAITTGDTGVHGGIHLALSGAVLSAFVLLGSVAWAASPTEQLPAGPMQEKATAACTSCHEARIIVQQRLSKAAWMKEVDKMVKWGAEVDSKDRDALIDYLSANFGPEQPAYVAPKSASQSQNHKGH
jgi:hypothetical protein